MFPFKNGDFFSFDLSTMMKNKVSVMVVGCGNMGSSHARAFHKLDNFDLVGLVDKSHENREKLSEELGGIDQYDDFDTAMAACKPDAVAICTYPGTPCCNTESHHPQLWG